MVYLEGAENADDWSAVLDLVQGCPVLVTTRNERQTRSFHAWRIPPLTEDAALRLLLANADVKAPEDDALLRRLCHALGLLPLALQLFGKAFYHEFPTGTDDAFVREVLDEEADASHEKRGRKHIPTLVQRTLAHVPEQARLAFAALGACANVPTPIDILSAGVEQPVPQTKRLMQHLRQQGLVRMDEAEPYYHEGAARWRCSHALIYAEAREAAHHASETQSRVLAALHTLLYEQTKNQWHPHGYQAQVSMMPHLHMLVEERARVLGLDHPSTLTSMNNLAGLLDSTGRYGEAEPLYRQALEGSERVLGLDHPDTLLSVNNLAGLLDSTGRYGEAEPLYRRALEGSERVLGLDHPSTLSSMNNLAYLLQATGRYGEAEPLYRRALEGRERVLGLDHPSTLLSQHNLGHFLVEQNQCPEGMPLLERAAAMAQRTLGAEHPYTLAFLRNLVAAREQCS
ncbi:MAG: hypothetical protein RhofKO_28760 [Rhodothermales bacterium]